MAQRRHAARSGDAPRATVSDEAAHAANVLLLGPSLDARRAAACGGLLDAATVPNGVVLVTLVGDPAARLAAWRDHATAPPPDRVAVVTSGPTDSPTDDTERLAVPGSDVTARVARVGRPPDLVSVWMAVSERLDSWDGRTAVCLDSLTALLGIAEPRRTLRFCETLADRIRTGGDAAHYHLDPGAVDDRVVETFAELFDGVAEHPSAEAG
jgi:hypothetical protein